MRTRSLAYRILNLLASDRGTLPGLSLGDIEIALDLPHGTATHQRITELREYGRAYGWEIRTNKEENRYYMLSRHASKARAFIRKHPSFIAAAVERRRKAA